MDHELDNMQNKQMMQKNKSAVGEKKLTHGKHFSRNFHPSVWIIPAIPLESGSTERLISCYIYIFFNSWGIPNFKLLEMLTATLLPVIVSLFNLVLSKLCHQPRYDHTDCHPSVYCINCSSIHKIQHRWKFTHPNEVLFSFHVLNGYWLPWLQPELPRSLINYLPAEHLASRG